MGWHTRESDMPVEQQCIPHYEKLEVWMFVLNERLDYTEVVEVNYDKNIISLSDILEVFFENHDYAHYHSKRFASSVFYTTQDQQEETHSFIEQNIVWFLYSISFSFI